MEIVKVLSGVGHPVSSSKVLAAKRGRKINYWGVGEEEDIAGSWHFPYIELLRVLC